MKRTVAVLLGVMVLGGLSYVGSSLAQPGKQATPTAPTAPTPKSRVAVVNIRLVGMNWNKAKAYQEELKKDVEPFQKQEQNLKVKAETLLKERQDLKTTAQRREAIEKEMKTLQRQYEDLKVEAEKTVGKKSEQQVAAMFYDILTVVHKYAEREGLECVLQHGEIDLLTEQKDFYSPNNLAYRLGKSPLIPLYTARGVDITNDIVRELNAAYAAKNPAPAPAPSPTPAPR